MAIDIIIDVTQADIDSGIPMSASNCPVALAYQREHPGNGVSVSAFGIRLGNDWYTPRPKIRDWIKDFDRRRPVNPIKVECRTDNAAAEIMAGYRLPASA